MYAFPAPVTIYTSMPFSSRKLNSEKLYERLIKSKPLPPTSHHTPTAVVSQDFSNLFSRVF